MAKDNRSDHIVEDTLLEVCRQIGDPYELGIREPSGRCCLSQFLIENSSGDRVLPAQHISQMLGPEAAPRAELQNLFTRQHMQTVAHSQGTTAEVEGRCPRITKPISLTTQLHLAEVSLD